MAKRKIVIRLLLIGAAILFAAVGVGLFLFNKPHRDVQATAVDVTITADALVREFLSNPPAASEKYLDESGDSKIIAVSGTVHSSTMDLKGQVVVLLKSTENAGVSCTFMQASNSHAESLKPGDQITVKGVIRSGAGFDPDLELYEDVVLEQCDILKK